MSTFFCDCLVDQRSLDQLADNAVLAKQASIQLKGYLMLLLVALFVGMAFVLSSYLMAASSWALIPALADYSKKRKAIRLHLQKRHLA